MTEEEKIKETIEAHGTTSKELAETKAKDVEKVSQEMVNKEDKKEEISDKEKQEIIEKKEGEEREKYAGKKYDKRKRRFQGPTKEETLAAWEPKTKLGHDVKNGKITDIEYILDNNMKILEPGIVDKLLDLKSDLIAIGQSKGKFGGGKRRAWRQTQRKTREGNVPTFSTLAVVGDEDGHIGIGEGKAKETLPARDKAIRKAKLNLMRITRTCAAFDCACSELHTVPFEVTGKSGSVKVTLIPAPQGTGLVVGNELKKILKLAGIKDVYSKTSGRQRTTFNFIKACINALKETNRGIKK
jgi:small subunit ribosomal protein S5